MRSKSLTLLIVAGAALGGLTACGPDKPAAAPSTATTSAAASPSAAGMTVAAACQAVDAVYTTLDSQAKVTVVQGITAEMKGDSAGVKAALTKLRPVFASVAATSPTRRPRSTTRRSRPPSRSWPTPRRRRAATSRSPTSTRSRR